MRSKLLASTVLGIGAMAAFSVISSTPKSVLAACLGPNTDTIICDAANPPANGGGTLFGTAGQDTLTVDDVNVGDFGEGPFTIDLLGDDDNADITNSTIAAGAAGSILGNDGNDVLNINGGSFIGDGATGSLEGNAGEDTLIVDDTTVGINGGLGSVDGGADNDTITVQNGSTVGTGAGSTGSILGGGGEDNITVTGSVVGTDGGTGSVLGGLGDDIITIDSSTIGDDGGTGTVDGGGGNDTITVQNGSIVGTGIGSTGSILGSGGDDTIVVDASTIGAAGGTGSVDGGTGSDTITVTGSTVGVDSGSTGSVLGRDGEDNITIDSSTIGTLGGTGTVDGGADNDLITVQNGSTVGTGAGSTGTVQGRGGEDTIIIDDSTIGTLGGTGTVDGGADNDTITVRNGSTVGTGVGSSGSIEGRDGEDNITVNASTIGADSGTGTVDGGTGDDILTVDGSTVGTGAGSTGDVLGDAGEDTIVVDASTIGASGGTGTVDGGTENDTITVQNGSNVGTGAGSTGSILGSGGEDNITISSTIGASGGTGTVDGGADNDTITVENGSTIGFSGGTGTVDGGSENDTITVGDGSTVGSGAGSTGSILGSGGEDTIVVDDSSIGAAGGTGTVDGDSENDTITVQNGSTVGFGPGSMGDVLGDAGEDTIVVDGSTIGASGGTGTVDGGADNDTITVQNGSTVGTGAGSTGSILGSGGEDIILVDASIIGDNEGTGTVNGGIGDDVITITNGSVLAAGSTANIEGDGDNDVVNINADGEGTFGPGQINLDGGEGMDTLNIDVAGGEETLKSTDSVTAFETFNKTGPGTLNWNTASTFTTGDPTKGIFIQGGIFNMNANLGGDMTIASGTLVNTLDGTMLTGSMTLNGTMNLGGTSAAPFETFTVDGDFTGGGGTIQMDTFLDDGTTGSDMLTITGNASGTTFLDVTNQGGPGDQTVTGIKLVEVQGTAEANNFSLAGGPLIAGSFQYNLVFEPGATNDFLLKTGLSAEGNVLTNAVTMAQGQWRTSVASLHERLGEARENTQSVVGSTRATQYASLEPGTSQLAQSRKSGRGKGAEAWVRVFGAEHEVDPDMSTGGTGFDQTNLGVQAGLGFIANNVGGAGNTLHYGLVGGYSHADIDMAGVDGDLDAPQFGLYASWFGNNWYLDTLALGGPVSFDFTMPGLGISSSFDGYSVGGSIETGYTYRFRGGEFVEPQAQLTYNRVDFNTRDSAGNNVNVDDGDSLSGRLGLRVGTNLKTRRGMVWTPYVKGSVKYEFLADNRVSIAGFQTFSEVEGLSGEAVVGLTGQLNDSVSVFLNGTYEKGEHIEAVQGMGGVKVEW